MSAMDAQQHESTVWFVRQTAPPSEEAQRSRHLARRHPSHWIWTAVVIAAVVYLVVRAGGNRNFEWSVVGQYFAAQSILKGIIVTLELTAISQVAAIIGGCILALMRQSSNAVFRTVSAVYTWLFRSVPLLVQIIIWFNFALLVPHIGLSTPFGSVGPWNTNTLISGFTAALLGLSLNESAYMGEIIRGGILSVPQGQYNAALSLGLTRARAMRSVILPQTIRAIVPPTGNQFIGLLKASSMVSVVGGGDLLTNAQYIYGQNFKVMPLLIIASIWYLILTSIASVGQYFLEQHFDTSRSRPSRKQAWWACGRRLVGLGRRRHD